MSKPIVPNRYGNYYERRAYREMNKRTPEAIAAEKAEKLRLSKTCQICGRAIFAETGTIAHHGYERPFEGYQTASCPGAKKLPFEVTNAALVKHVADQQTFLEQRIENRAKLAADAIPAIFSWTYYDRTIPGRMSDQRRTKTVSITPETFEEIRAENQSVFIQHSMSSYARIKEADLRHRDGAIKQLADYITFQEQRLASWKGPTFKRENGEWVAL